MAAEFWFNDSGTQRKSKEVYFNDGGTLRKAKEIWYNDSGTMRKVFQSGLSRVVRLTLQRFTDTARPWNRVFQLSTSSPNYMTNFLGDSRSIGIRFFKVFGEKNASGDVNYSVSNIIMYFRTAASTNIGKINSLDNIYISVGNHKVRLEYMETSGYRIPTSVTSLAERTRLIEPFVTAFDNGSVTADITFSDVN